MFRLNLRMRDIKPYVAELPDVKDGNSDCSFCWMVFYIGDAELTPGDKTLYREHLRKCHGLVKDIIA